MFPMGPIRLHIRFSASTHRLEDVMGSCKLSTCSYVSCFRCSLSLSLSCPFSVNYVFMVLTVQIFLSLANIDPDVKMPQVAMENRPGHLRITSTTLGLLPRDPSGWSLLPTPQTDCSKLRAFFTMSSVSAPPLLVFERVRAACSGFDPYSSTHHLAWDLSGPLQTRFGVPPGHLHG